jgi:hypothetical protein
MLLLVKYRYIRDYTSKTMRRAAGEDHPLDRCSSNCEWSLNSQLFRKWFHLRTVLESQ